MIEISIALISSLTTLSAVYLKNKMQAKKIKNSFSDIINDDRVDEFIIHVKNKKNFPFESNASELITKNNKLKITVGYSKDIINQDFVSNSENINLIHEKLERFIYG